MWLHHIFSGGICVPVWWNSKKIKRVVRSTLAAETLETIEGVDMALYISTLITEMLTIQQIPIVCITVCQSLCDAVKSNRHVSEERLRMELSGLKELLINKQITGLQWCETKKQLADCLTKTSNFSLMKTLTQGFLDYI